MIQFGLPQSAQFLGFVVHRSDNDEFLALFEGHKDYALSTAWSKIPDLSYIFESQKDAEKFASEYGSTAVAGLLFDLGETYSLHVIS